MLLYSVALLALFASAQGRAVNISNTWVLPEEGFPVFYRYFRDRISWYEADAVCQFHHANLVTVDTTAQYDAVRAYLKELDISSAVWVGLIRSNPDGDFTWTDYRGLSGEGYWSSAPDTRASPLCAAADPAADYRWEARACGGPTVASFICELPVPQWALGNEGCMVRALPALTILYLPESAAVQLTADCGLAGVKRVQCTGNVKRENLLKDLSCADEEESTTSVSVMSSGNTWPSITDAIFVDQETTTETATEENGTTEHEDDINQTSTILPPSSTNIINTATEYKILTMPIHVNKFNRINNNLDKNFDLNLVNTNNLQSNHIPKIANTDNYLTNEHQDKIEDEKYIQHKMLHEEIARLGNLDNIFTQPTDHFVPPLVMAKAKISDGMTVLSLQEKLAQQLAEQHLAKQINQHRQDNHIYDSDITKPTTEEPKAVTIDKIIYVQAMKSNKKEKAKTSMPKKYNEKASDPKSKVQKIVEMKSITIDRITTPTETVTKHIETNYLPLVGRLDNDEDSLNLTVLLNENPEPHEEKVFYNYSGDVSRLEVVRNSTLKNDTDMKLLDVEATEQAKHEIPSNDFEEKIKNTTLNDEVLNITIISNGYTTAFPVVFEITTKTPVLFENVSVHPSPSISKDEDKINTSTSKNVVETTKITLNVEPAINISINSSLITNLQNDNISEVSFTEEEPTKLPKIASTTITPNVNTTFVHANMDVKDITPKEATTTANSHITHGDDHGNANTEAHEEDGINSNLSDPLDDFNSPLLSGANEPVRRPNRSRRPQPPPNRNKFNPFRILG